MNRGRTLVALLSLIVLATSATAQDKRYATRIELHSIQTLTLSDEAFLRGEPVSAKPVTVSGQLRLGPGGGRMPVVVLVHGSGGMGSNIDLWTHELADGAIATFAIDGFTGRGLTQVSTNQAQLGHLNREEAPGRLVNTATGHLFTYLDACVERNPHVGHDPVATQAAVQSVREFLKTVFKP